RLARPEGWHYTPIPPLPGEYPSPYLRAVPEEFIFGCPAGEVGLATALAGRPSGRGGTPHALDYLRRGGGGRLVREADRRHRPPPDRLRDEESDVDAGGGKRPTEPRAEP